MTTPSVAPLVNPSMLSPLLRYPQGRWIRMRYVCRILCHALSRSLRFRFQVQEAFPEEATISGGRLFIQAPIRVAVLHLRICGRRAASG